jgi:hypothetical protein
VCSSRWLEFVFAATLVFACSRSERPSHETAGAVRSAAALASASASVRDISAAAPPSAAASAEPKPAAKSSEPLRPAADRYAWLASEAGKALQVDGSLESRISPPPGYARVRVEPGSFSEWLRGLPLAPGGTPVTAHDGSAIRGADDDYVAAVVAIDVGGGDLQQSADVILRLHAEWLWSRGEKSAISYRGANKLAMPLSRWEKGQRLVAGGPTAVYWAVKTKPKPADYVEFRRFLDAVFTWANSTSLAQRSERVEQPEALAPGDFFLHARAPGHVAIVLDVAEKPSGERVALLGQGLNPAQSVHVLRPGRATPWFSLRPGLPIVTPYTREFGWDELRRLARAAGDDENEPAPDAGAAP